MQEESDQEDFFRLEGYDTNEPGVRQRFSWPR